VDTLTGTANADSIIGAGSADKLTGGASADTFIYKAISITDLMNEVGSALGVNATTAPSLTTVDTITDFISGTDKIQLSVALANSVNGTNSTVYTATTTSGLLAADFVATTATGLAADAGNARFYVNTANNVLYFDNAGDTVIDANNAYTAGATDDFAVLQLTGAVTGTDFVFA
jgi:Ca2+-binding RTX toxin-like protein